MNSLKIMIVVFLFARTVTAQIVLGPKASGTYSHGTEFSFYSPPWGHSETSVSYVTSVSTQAIKNGRNWGIWSSYPTWVYSHFESFNGIFEFDLEKSMGDAPFPPDWMTSNGWTAQLENLEVIQACNTPYFENPGVDLYDMADNSQDGVISTADINTRTHITRLSEVPPPVGSMFTVDVTAALRHDLFGPVQYSTSGFVLKPTVGQKHVNSVLYWSDDVKITINFSFETPTPEHTPEPTITPTPENPCDELKVQIRMPAKYFSPGDTCSCMAVICNPGPEIHTHVPLFVILDVFGTYLFWPDFSSFDYIILETVPAGPMIVQVIPEFAWPEGAGTVLDGVQWIAAMTDPEITSLLGSAGKWPFGWGN